MHYSSAYYTSRPPSLEAKQRISPTLNSKDETCSRSATLHERIFSTRTSFKSLTVHMCQMIGHNKLLKIKYIVWYCVDLNSCGGINSKNAQFLTLTLWKTVQKELA